MTKINKYRHVRLYGEPIRWPKTMPAVTDEGREFEAVLCEKCGGDTFHIGLFDGQPQYQCIACYPTTKLTVH